MVSVPINPTIPLSPEERSQLTEEDREAIDAWRYRLPCDSNISEEHIIRLYLRGKRAGIKAGNTVTTKQLQESV